MSLDVDAFLDTEKRTGIKNDDIDSFLSKVNDVQKQLDMLQSGELKPEDVKVPGEKTAEELKEEAEEKALRAREKAARKAKEKKEGGRGRQLLVTHPAHDHTHDHMSSCDRVQVM